MVIIFQQTFHMPQATSRAGLDESTVTVLI